jgi:hypothetical protein
MLTMGLLKSLVTAGTFILLASTVIADNTKISKTFEIHQAFPNIVHLDIDREGASPGDVLAFDADLTSATGLSGKLSGIMFTVRIPDAHLIFDFGDSNTLVVTGSAKYPHKGDGQMSENQPQLRAIIGGTGLYMGSRGQVQTSRNSDGTYKHLIQLME